MTELLDLSHTDPATLHAAGLLELLVERQGETRDAVRAAAAGADSAHRLSFGSTGFDQQPYARVEFGEAMQGWTVVNDGPSDVYLALSSDRLNATGRILTVPAGTWASLPLITSRLYVGPTVAGSAGSALVLALAHAPDPGFGAVAGTAESAATVAKLALTGASQTLAAANGGRRGGAIYNDSSAILYVKLGDSASADDWTVELAAGDYYELPANYAGNVTAFAASATGQARVTEFS